MATTEELDNRRREFRYKIGDLIDEYADIIGPAATIRANPEQFVDEDQEYVDEMMKATPAAWVLAVEVWAGLEDTQAGSAAVTFSPELQTPMHTVGLLHWAIGR